MESATEFVYAPVLIAQSKGIVKLESRAAARTN